jgi:hypothetical protein
MSFRRDAKGMKHWKDWRRRHAGVLSSCGLPEVVYRDEAAWENFLAEGFLPDGCGVWSGWEVERLAPEQARRLLAFLTRECSDHPFQRDRMNLLHRLLRADRRWGR